MAEPRFERAADEQLRARCEVIADLPGLARAPVIAVLTSRRLVLCHLPAQAFRLGTLALLALALTSASLGWQWLEACAVLLLLLGALGKSRLPWRRIVASVPATSIVGVHQEAGRITLSLRDGTRWELSRPTWPGGLPSPASLLGFGALRVALGSALPPRQP